MYQIWAGTPNSIWSFSASYTNVKIPPVFYRTLSPLRDQSLKRVYSMFTFYRALVHTICRIKWQAWSQCRLAQSLNLLKYSNLHRRWQNQEKHQQASASTLEWEVVRHLPQWNQLRKQWKVHHPKSQKQNNSSQHSGTVYVLRVDYTVFRSGWALWVYTAARGNPNTYLHVSFPMNKFI